MPRLAVLVRGPHVGEREPSVEHGAVTSRLHLLADPRHVSATATIGYLSFLCGPPVLGFVSEHIGLLNTLYIIVVLVVASGLFSSAARPIAGSQVGAGHQHG